MEHFFQNIQGHFSFPNFYRSVIMDALDGSKIVELGVWRGRSFSFLLVEAINSGKKLDLFAVDSWEFDLYDSGLQEKAMEMPSNPFDEFLDEMVRRGLDDKFTIIRRRSEEAALQFEDGTVDMVFIDANHEYEDVCNDIETWLPKVRDGGIISGHDYNYHGVRDAVNQLVPERSVDARENIWIFRR